MLVQVVQSQQLESVLEQRWAEEKAAAEVRGEAGVQSGRGVGMARPTWLGSGWRALEVFEVGFDHILQLVFGGLDVW